MAGVRAINRFGRRFWLSCLALVVLSLLLSACRAEIVGAVQIATNATLPATEKSSNLDPLLGTKGTLTRAATKISATQKIAGPSSVVPTATTEGALAVQGQSPRPSPSPVFTPVPISTLKPASPSPVLPTAEPVRLPPEDWKLWPVIPQVPPNARRLYQQGLALGNDPHAFSVLGDCQSLPEIFMGVFDTDTSLVAGLPPGLQAVVANFAGSFNRYSPTVKSGATAGAILWDAWHENKYTCQTGETPLDCELRLHKPSIVIINLGTHYETRNILYLRKILDRLTAQGVVPILATKADNRELDERLNLEMAILADEYEVPLWNFWAAVSDLPDHGLVVKKGYEIQGEIYLSEEGLARHRYTALQALAAVWMAVR